MSRFALRKPGRTTGFRQGETDSRHFSLLPFFGAKERKCPRGMSGEAKRKCPPGMRAAKKVSYKEQMPCRLKAAKKVPPRHERRSEKCHSAKRTAPHSGGSRFGSDLPMSGRSLPRGGPVPLGTRAGLELPEISSAGCDTALLNVKFLQTAFARASGAAPKNEQYNSIIV